MGLRTWLGIKKRFAPSIEERFSLHTQLRAMLRRIRPMRAVGHDKTRIGRVGDGGYVMLDDLSDVAVAFSVGIGDDCSWDFDIAERGILVHQFDPSVERSPQDHPRFRFHRRRLSAQPGPDAVTLAELAKMAGNANAILKVDVESAEWTIFAAAPELSSFAQIIVEFHSLGRSAERMQLYDAAVANLARDFQAVHVHGNNVRPITCVLGVPVPSVLEVTFANRARYEFATSDEEFPGPLDHPNIADQPDLWLSQFRY